MEIAASTLEMQPHVEPSTAQASAPVLVGKQPRAQLSGLPSEGTLAKTYDNVDKLVGSKSGGCA